MPAQVVTPLETIESWDPETQLLARNRLVISLRLCRTAKLDLASARKSQSSVSQSTTAPMSSTACVSARGTSQKIGRKPPRCGLSWGTNLATPAASAKEVASMLGSPSLSPRKPIHKMAKAAR